jgi:GT2 family glycosyltransferase/Tfp pilus assembly protein PilF
MHAPQASGSQPIRIAVVYVHPIPPEPKHLEQTQRFLQSYREFPAQQDHTLYVMCNGGPPTDETRALFSSVNCQFREHDDTGWDIGAFQRAAREIGCDMMVFLGGHAYFRKAGWLRRMAEVFDPAHLFGATASHEHDSHIRTTGFWCAPDLLRSYPHQVVTYPQRLEFEQGEKSLTRWAQSLGRQCFMVTWSGCYPVLEWRDERNWNIYRRGDQSECLVFDRVTDNYAQCVAHERYCQEGLADGWLRWVNGHAVYPSIEKTTGVTGARQLAPRLKVAVLSADPRTSACGYLRLTSPLTQLQAQKQVEFLPIWSGGEEGPTLETEILRRANIVVVQRGMAAHLPYSVLRKAMPKSAARIVFELDDALTLVPATHEAAAYYASVRPQLEEYLRNADLVTVSTPKLKELYSGLNERVEVLPNVIDADLWLPVVPKGQPRQKLAVLFSGTLTHQRDLALIEPAIQQIALEFADRVEFVFWGNAPAGLSVLPNVRSLCGFTADYCGYAQRLKRLAIDLALVPLEQTPFNRAKSPIKWLEYSACKIPAIFTDIEAYNQTVEHGKTGWLVPNQTEAWYEAIKQFVINPELRRTIAENAHQAVLSKHLLRDHAGLWREAYDKLFIASGRSNMRAPAQASIIIPVFNNLALTRQCLDSIQANTPQGCFEVILVDNGSSDGTREFLREEEAAGRVRVLFNAENQGFARACNQGAQKARHPQLVFLNNDTVVTSGWLTALLSVAENAGVGVVGAKLLYGDGRIQHAGIEFINGVPDHPHRHASADAPEVNRFRELDMVTGACLLIRRELFLQLAGFDEAYRNGVEDIDLCLRARIAGWKVVYQPKSVVYHLEGQSAGRFDHVTQNLKLFFQRWQGQFDPHMRLRTGGKALIRGASRSLFQETARRCRVAWEGTYLDFGSLSHVNREFTRQLAGWEDVSLIAVDRASGLGSTPAKELESVARRLVARSPAEVEVTVRHSWPPDWRRPSAGKLVVIQPWEYGKLPLDWVRQSQQVDEFWLPSEYVRRVFLDSGVPAGKLRVVPNGIDPGRFHPDAEPLDLPTSKRFKFLFVGGTIHRKGADLLLQSYLETFRAKDDVCLVIKDFGTQTTYAGQTLEAAIRAAQRQPDAPEILYLTEELPSAQLPGLYTACNCLVHPYRGEGFGLPILEAMACGRPVVLTAGGAADDFATEALCYRVPATRKFFGDTVSGLKLAGPGWLLEPDSAALSERMKWVSEHRPEAQAKGELASQVVRERWTWAHSAELARDRLLELSKSADRPTAEAQAPVKPKAPAIVLPACALVGHLGEAREFLARKNPRKAWEAAVAALKRRPFHPEAYLLLAELAQVAGDSASARLCAEHARRMAPGWKPARQFLNRRLKGGARPTWLTLPNEVSVQPGPFPRLSVCLITRNEERFLDQCLTSIRGLADQIVVVDTGSTDRTVEIARQHSAEVYSFTWCDDFSAARNCALEHATGDWVLVLDADEQLSPEGRDKLRSHLTRADTMAWRLPIIDAGRETEGRSYVPRLFRNAPALFYIGRVHEQVFSSIEVRRQEWGLENRLGEAALLHYGYTAEVTRSRSKIERNLRLLERAVAELPHEPHLLMHLGLELARSGREAEALARYREAFAALAGLPASQVVPELRETLLAQFCTRLAAAREFGEIVQVLTSPTARVQGGLNATLRFALGLAYIETGRHDLAIEPMTQCVATRHQASLSPVNPEILTGAPWHCLALCHWRLGNPATADQAFEASLKEPGSRKVVRHDYARFLCDQNRPIEALQRLHEAVGEDRLDPIAWRLGGQIALSRPQFLEFACDWSEEAVRHLPEDPQIVLQRAEALLLNQQVETSHALWVKICRDRTEPACLAALILCQLLEDAPPSAELGDMDKEAVTRAFLHWYRKCVAAGAKSLIVELNQRTGELARVLPEAARILQAVAVEVQSTVPAEPCLA